MPIAAWMIWSATSVVLLVVTLRFLEKDRDKDKDKDKD